MKDFMLTEVTRTAKYTEVYFDEFQKHYWQKELNLLIFAITICPDSTNNFFCTAISLHGNELMATKLLTFTET